MSLLRSALSEKLVEITGMTFERIEEREREREIENVSLYSSPLARQAQDGGWKPRRCVAVKTGNIRCSVCSSLTD